MILSLQIFGSASEISIRISVYLIRRLKPVPVRPKPQTNI